MLEINNRVSFNLRHDHYRALSIPKHCRICSFRRMKTSIFKLLNDHNLQPYNSSFIGSEMHIENNKTLLNLLNTLYSCHSDFDPIASENQLWLHLLNVMICSVAAKQRTDTSPLQLAKYKNDHKKVTRWIKQGFHLSFYGFIVKIGDSKLHILLCLGNYTGFYHFYNDRLHCLWKPALTSLEPKCYNLTCCSYAESCPGA